MGEFFNKIENYLNSTKAEISTKENIKNIYCIENSCIVQTEKNNYQAKTVFLPKRSNNYNIFINGIFTHMETYHSHKNQLLLRVSNSKKKFHYSMFSLFNEHEVRVCDTTEFSKNKINGDTSRVFSVSGLHISKNSCDSIRNLTDIDYIKLITETLKNNDLMDKDGYIERYWRIDIPSFGLRRNSCLFIEDASNGLISFGQHLHSNYLTGRLGRAISDNFDRWKNIKIQ